MTNYIERSTPLSILNDAMTEEYRITVVRRCLEHLAQVGPQARRCLQIALRKHIRLPGFPDPNDAIKSPKRPLLLAEVVKCISSFKCTHERLAARLGRVPARSASGGARLFAQLRRSGRRTGDR